MGQNLITAEDAEGAEEEVRGLVSGEGQFDFWIDCHVLLCGLVAMECAAYGGFDVF